MRHFVGLSLSLALGSVIGAGCAPYYYDPYAYTTSAVVTTTTYDSGLVYTSVYPYYYYYPYYLRDDGGGGGDGGGGTEPRPQYEPVAAAQAAAAAAPQLFQPASCVTTSINEATVTYQLQGCTGPLGIRNATGTYTAQFAATPAGQPQVTLQSSNLSINGRPVQLSTQALITQSDNSRRTLQVMSQNTGTDQNGQQVRYTGNYTLTWNQGESCATLNGTFSDQVNTSNASTTVSDFVMCSGACPRSGTATRTAGDQSVSVTFNGSSDAQWRNREGRTGTVALNCQ